MKTRCIFAGHLLLLAACAFVQAEASDDQVSATFLKGLIHEALTSHPTMKAAQARAEAAAAAVGTVRLWEDPQLGLGLTAARRSMRMDDGDIMVGLDQMLPRRGLYDAEKRRAVADQQMQQASGRQVAITLGLAVAQASLELALADDLIRLQEENLVWLKSIVKTAEERAKNPDATATETLRMESELAIRSQALASLQRQRAQFATALNLLLGRVSDSPWRVLSLVEVEPRIGEATALKALLERNNPQLAAMRHQVEGAQADADASREKRKPIFSVGVETHTYSGGDFRDAMFALKVTLPWFNRPVYEADKARAEHLRDATRADLEAQERELYTQLTKLLTEARNNQQLARAYGSEVIPKSEKAVETLQNAWVSSKATLLEVLDSRRSLIEARQEQRRALAAQHMALQALAAITGELIKTTGK